MTGPLQGLTVIELGAIGPVPFCGMLLGDLGADVLRIDRPKDVKAPSDDPKRLSIHRRNHRSIGVDLKLPAGRDLVLRMVGSADVMIEGNRPGALEHLGLGPAVCHDLNPRLVIGRMTGWGQSGPLSGVAGHDINYIAASGALSCIGPRTIPPPPPMSFLGDFGGGGMLMAFGILAALHEVGRSGKGQVIDAAMVDGAALLSSHLHGFRHTGYYSGERESNPTDGGAPFYNTYETSDGKYISIGALEDEFFAQLIQLVPELDVFPGDRHDRSLWPSVRELYRQVFIARTRSEWNALLQNTDACYAPVLTIEEAPFYPHNVERQSFVEVAGIVQPGPAPRFSRSRPDPPSAPNVAGFDSRSILGDWGLPQTDIDNLIREGVVLEPEEAS